MRKRSLRRFRTTPLSTGVALIFGIAAQTASAGRVVHAAIANLDADFIYLVAGLHEKEPAEGLAAARISLRRTAAYVRPFTSKYGVTQMPTGLSVS